jgi:predicted RNA-binding protein with TRAM domain
MITAKIELMYFLFIERMLNEIETQLTRAEADSSQSGVEKLPKPERGAEIELHTHTLAFEGKAVARRSDGYVVFVEGALADETVRARILKAKSSFAEARLTEIVKPSPDRRESDCPDFGICGGCSMLHLRYDKQIFWKRQQVRETFERIGGFVDPPLTDTVGAPTEFVKKRLDRVQKPIGSRSDCMCAEGMTVCSIQRTASSLIRSPTRYLMRPEVLSANMISVSLMQIKHRMRFCGFLSFDAVIRQAT